jgi:hypothetical protein
LGGKKGPNPQLIRNTDPQGGSVRGSLSRANNRISDRTHARCTYPRYNAHQIRDNHPINRTTRCSQSLRRPQGCTRQPQYVAWAVTAAEHLVPHDHVCVSQTNTHKCHVHRHKASDKDQREIMPISTLKIASGSDDNRRCPPRSRGHPLHRHDRR